MDRLSTVLIDMREPESFLSRWSRRKTDDKVHSDDPQSSDVADGASTEGSPEPAATDADMPPLESLGEDSDYSGFLSPEVSDKLRQTALRKLFHGKAFNIVDGLDDYDDDFITALPLGDIVTADMRHQAEIELEKAKAALLDDPTGEATEEALTDDTAATEDSPEDERNEVVTQSSEPATGDDDDTPAPLRQS